MALLKNLQITANLSEAAQLLQSKCVIQVTTSASSTITFERSIDGVNFSAIPDVSLAANGVAEINLDGFVRGQWLRVRSTATMTSCKILQR